MNSPHTVILKATICVAALAILLAAYVTNAQSGNISQLNLFVSANGVVRLASSTADFRVSSLANCDTIDTDGNGVFFCGTDDGGAGPGGGVTAVGLTVPTGLTATGSPVTGSSTIAITLTSGYVIPLTASTTEWNTAYLNRITSLGGQTGATQTFASSTSGTDFRINSATNVHTFTVPSASASARGLLTSGDWSIFNSKISSTSLSTVFPLAYNSTTGAISWIGLATSSALTPGQALYASGLNTIASTATGTVSGTNGVTVTAGRSVFGGALAIDCTVSTAAAAGCLSSTDWTTFNTKVSSTSIDTSSELATLLTNETGSGSLVFGTNPTLAGFISTASSTIGGGTSQTGLTINGTATSTNLIVTSNTTSATLTVSGLATLGSLSTASGTITTASTTNLSVSKLFGSNGSPGTNGSILQTTGSAASWVATSTLGLLGRSEVDTSAEVAAILSDETGTGAAVFGTSATLASTTLTGSTTMQRATSTDLSVTGALQVPNGTNPTTDAQGECAFDSTSSQLRCFGTTTNAVYSPRIESAFVYASSSLGAATTTFKVSGFPSATTFGQLGCTNQGAGTFLAVLGNGTASSTPVRSGTGMTVSFTTLSSNNAFAAGSSTVWSIGSVTGGTVIDPSCSYQRAETAV